MPKGPCAYVEGNVEGVQVQYTVDTGASRTIMSQQVFDKIYKDTQPTLREYTDLPLEQATGVPLKECGVSEMDLVLNRQSEDHRELENLDSVIRIRLCKASDLKVAGKVQHLSKSWEGKTQGIKSQVRQLEDLHDEPRSVVGKRHANTNGMSHWQSFVRGNTLGSLLAEGDEGQGLFTSLWQVGVSVVFLMILIPQQILQAGGEIGCLFGMDLGPVLQFKEPHLVCLQIADDGRLWPKLSSIEQISRKTSQMVAVPSERAHWNSQS